MPTTDPRAAAAGSWSASRWRRLALPVAMGASLAAASMAAAPALADSHAPAKGSAGLTSNSLFDLLVGELAARAGDHADAARRYLSAAQRTANPEVAERAARLALFGRDYATALKAARLWSSLAPDSDEALQATASLLLHSGDPSAEQAFFDLFDRMKKSDPATAYDRLGQILGRSANSERADAVMNAVVERESAEPAAQLALARYLARSERFDLAAAAVDAYLARQPDDPGAIALKAELLRRLDMQDAAVKVLADGVARLPDSTDLRSAYARALVSQDRFDEAVVEYEKVLEAAPEDADSRYSLALMLLQSDKPAEAKAQFEKLTEDLNRRYTAWYYLGRIAESEARYDDALDAYRRVDRGDQRMQAQMRYAQVLGDQGKLEEARAHLHGLRGRSDEELIGLIRAEGDLLTSAKRYEEAMSLYDTALRDHEDDPNLLYARAMAAEKVDRIDVLERDLRKIIANEPDNADALNALGYTLADRTDRYEEALAMIAKAVELQPDSHYIIDSMGWVLYRMGRLDEAEVQLRRAFELRPDAEVGAHLGEVLWVNGKRDEAKAVWEQAAKSRPDDETLKQTRKRFGL